MEQVEEQFRQDKALLTIPANQFCIETTAANESENFKDLGEGISNLGNSMS